MATISDVAARCGVAKSTVSNVVNGKGHVSESLRVRVLEAVRELQYTPSPTAVRLSLGTSGASEAISPPGVGLYVDAQGSLTHLLRELAVGVGTALGALGIDVAMLARDTPGVGGYEVAICLGTSDARPPEADPQVVPFKVHIAIDLQGALDIALEYLRMRGHASIGVLMSGEDALDSGLRPEGPSVRTLGAAATFSEGAAWASRRATVDALVFVSPHAALGYAAARQPQAMACACLVDSSDLCEVDPPVTAVRHDVARLVGEAVRAVLSRGVFDGSGALSLVERGAVPQRGCPWSRRDDEFLD